MELYKIFQQNGKMQFFQYFYEFSIFQSLIVKNVDKIEDIMSLDFSVVFRNIEN